MNIHKSTMIKGIFLGTLIMGLVTLWIFSNLAFERFEIALHVIMWSSALYTLYLAYQAYRLRTINPLIWAVLILWVFEELRFNLRFPGFYTFIDFSTFYFGAMSYLSFLLLLFCLVGGSLISAVGHFRRSAVLDTVFVTLLVLTLVCLTLNYDSYQFHELHLLEDPNFLAARLSLLVLVVGGAYDLIKKTGLAVHKLISFLTCFLMIWAMDIFNVFDLGNPLADTPDTYLMDSAILFGSMALGVFLINTWLTHREARILQAKQESGHL